MQTPDNWFKQAQQTASKKAEEKKCLETQKSKQKQKGFMYKRPLGPGGWDEYAHGYFLVNGQQMYKHPDGRVLPCSGVDSF